MGYYLVRYGQTQSNILRILGNGKPLSRRELVEASGLSSKAIGSALRRLWRSGAILRTENVLKERSRVFKGRSGFRSNLRSYYKYAGNSRGLKSTFMYGRRFVEYDKDEFEKQKPIKSKASMVLNFLKSNSGKAFYSKDVVMALKDKGVVCSDVMTNVRKAERKGLVYVRGYRMHDRQTPFQEGYLLTWIDPNKPREEAIHGAVQKTNVALANKAGTSAIIERVHAIRDSIIESTKLKDLVSFEFIRNKLDCSKYEAEGAIRRALQLYPDLREVKVFGIFKYYHHTSISIEELNATMEFKKNYVRMIKGRANRVGHNWEAIAEWFIDKFTTGATFQTQKHRRNRMDPRRITLHLIKSVGNRKQNAEVDRVWQVTPGVFAQPITYVLECKWGLVRKRAVDDFLEVLRWSKDFGVDTPEGRQIKQGVLGVFAGSAFNPKENVRLRDETVISLAKYAARMNIQLLKASDFNEKLRDRGCHKRITVQKICKISRNEKEVREVLEKMWAAPTKSDEILSKVLEKNLGVYDFEKMLEANA